MARMTRTRATTPPMPAPSMASSTTISNGPMLNIRTPPPETFEKHHHTPIRHGQARQFNLSQIPIRSTLENIGDRSGPFRRVASCSSVVVSFRNLRNRGSDLPTPEWTSYGPKTLNIRQLWPWADVNLLHEIGLPRYSGRLCPSFPRALCARTGQPAMHRG